MKKLIIPCTILAMTSMSFTSNNLDSNLEKEEDVLFLSCTERVSVDCDGDGQEDLGWEVACEHADAMLRQFEETCSGAGY